MKDAIQMQIYAETQNMSSQELLDYFNPKSSKDISIGFRMAAAMPKERTSI
jgi:hypothetical protein